MPRRSAAALAALVILGPGITVVQAQQRFRLGGGAGFAVVESPEIDFARTAAVGGSLGFRFNDNISIESSFTFLRSDRQYSELGVPIDEGQGGIPAFQFEANRYHLDGTFLFHIGRRQPFHPYVFAGAGLERADAKRTNFTYTFDENNVIVDRQEEVVLDATEYQAEGHAGAGFDLYFLYNVAARIEYRVWIPPDFDKRTSIFFFGVTYYF